MSLYMCASALLFSMIISEASTALTYYTHTRNVYYSAGEFMEKKRYKRWHRSVITMQLGVNDKRPRLNGLCCAVPMTAQLIIILREY